MTSPSDKEKIIGNAVTHWEVLKVYTIYTYLYSIFLFKPTKYIYRKQARNPGTSIEWKSFMRTDQWVSKWLSIPRVDV